MTIEPLNSPITTRKNSLSAAGISAGVMRTLRGLPANLLAVVVSLIMLTPVALVFINALKTKAQASSMGVDLPTALQWQNFATVIERASWSRRSATACCMPSRPP